MYGLNMLYVTFFSINADSKKQSGSWLNIVLRGAFVGHLYDSLVLGDVIVANGRKSTVLGQRQLLWTWYSHNWWHLAVCLLEQGSCSASKTVIQIYDKHLWCRFMKGAKASPQVYINALGLLLRLHLHGFHLCVESRLAEVARCLTNESSWHREWLLDLLAIWALSQTNCLGKASTLLKSLNHRVDALGTSQGVTDSLIRLAEALYEYGLENYKAVCDLLCPSFVIHHLKIIGASAEQLDVFEELWCISSLHAGDNVQAIQIASQRVNERSGVPFSWRILEKAYRGEGKTADAQFAAEKAQWLEELAES